MSLLRLLDLLLQNSLGILILHPSTAPGRVLHSPPPAVVPLIRIESCHALQQLLLRVLQDLHLAPELGDMKKAKKRCSKGMVATWLKPIRQFQPWFMWPYIWPMCQAWSVSSRLRTSFWDAACLASSQS